MLICRESSRVVLQNIKSSLQKGFLCFVTLFFFSEREMDDILGFYSLLTIEMNLIKSEWLEYKGHVF
jgi:hypothetical protein